MSLFEISRTLDHSVFKKCYVIAPTMERAIMDFKKLHPEWDIEQTREISDWVIIDGKEEK